MDFRDKLILALLKENVQFWEEFTCNIFWLWLIHCIKSPKSRIFKCDPTAFSIARHKKLWHCYFLQIWFWELSDITLAQIANFLQKCQIQIISEVQRWTSNFLTILKSTHQIWIVFARIRNGSIYFLTTYSN